MKIYAHSKQHSRAACLKLAASLFVVLLASQLPLSATQIVGYSLHGYFESFVDNRDASKPAWAPIQSESLAADGYPFHGSLQFSFPLQDQQPDDPSVGIYFDEGPHVQMRLAVTHPESGATENYNLTGLMLGTLIGGGPSTDFTILVADNDPTLRAEFVFPYSVPPDEPDVSQLPDNTSNEFFLKLNYYGSLFTFHDSPMEAQSFDWSTQFSRVATSVPDAGTSATLLMIAAAGLALARRVASKRSR